MTNKPFKILHLTHNWGNGGAALGARRLFAAMSKYDVNCEMLVGAINGNAKPDEGEPYPKVHAPSQWKLNQFIKLYRYLNRKQVSGNVTIKSFNLMDTGILSKINDSDADVVQCHWLGQNVLSIKELSRIKKPVFWKLPDMWAFTGAEHYDMMDDPKRYKDGYTDHNRPDHEGGWDINKWLWSYKKKHFQRKDFNLHIACPSQWMKTCVDESVILKGRPSKHILNPLNKELFQPMDKAQALDHFGLKMLADKKILMFGADAAFAAIRKGYAFLDEAIAKLAGTINPDDYAIIVFGNDGGAIRKTHGISTFCVGRISAQQELNLIYNTADVLACPTIRDNLPNVVKEATMCGIPVVGFDIGGMPDMVDHKRTGYLAKAIDTDDLAKGIMWCFDHNTPALRQTIRAEAEQKHSELGAALNYLHFYQEALPDHEGLQTEIERLEQLKGQQVGG